MTKEKEAGAKKRGRKTVGEPGPPSATPNEVGRKGKRAGKGDASGAVPKVGKHEANRDDSTGGELH
jgi:hypothetical protein